jgi:hypothetical protein
LYFDSVGCNENKIMDQQFLAFMYCIGREKAQGNEDAKEMLKDL